MTLKEWERDVINRQRNIVFPDTVLNEGRFYRNLTSGKAVFSVGQKTCLLLLCLYFASIAALALAGVIADIVQEDNKRDLTELWGWFYLMGWLAFGFFVNVKGLFPAPPPGRRRRYRRSSIE